MNVSPCCRGRHFPDPFTGLATGLPGLLSPPLQTPHGRKRMSELVQELEGMSGGTTQTPWYRQE